MTYYKDKFDTTKQLWSNLNKVCSLNKNKTTTFDSKDISDPNEICNKLNNCFCFVGRNLAQTLNSGRNTDFMKYIVIQIKTVCFAIPLHQMK